MRILITGGSGFIGTHLTKFLLAKNHIVTIFDNFSNSSKHSMSFFVEKGVEIIEGDIMNYDEIFKATKNKEVVIHLAAKISVSESMKNPIETFEVNVEGTKNVLNSCEKNHIKKFIASSSAAVYGEGDNNSPLNENSKKLPISPYGESKLKMEKEIREFKSKHNMIRIILRFFNIYGEGQTPEYAGVITRFIERIKQNKPLEVFGDGLQTRDFISIDDIINSINCAISTDKSGTYNIASGKTTSIKELAEYMVFLAGKKMEIYNIEPLKGDIKNSQADINLAKKELGFLPKFKLEKIKELLL